MIDYAKAAETLHAMIGDVDELYHHAVAPRNKQALTAAAALCEAHAAPVDEDSLRKEAFAWGREHCAFHEHDDTLYCAEQYLADAWLAGRKNLLDSILLP